MKHGLILIAGFLVAYGLLRAVGLSDTFVEGMFTGAFLLGVGWTMFDV